MKTQLKNYGIYLIGLFVASFGLALSTKAGLGTSPVASVAYSISLVNTHLSFGMWLNVWSLIQTGVEILVLRRHCRPLEIVIQTVLAFVYGYLTDFSGWLTRGLAANTYPIQFLIMLLGCFVVGLGIWIQFKGGVAMLPGEAMNRAISLVTGRRYENIKILFDVLYIVIAAVICFAALGRLEGVREGSIIAALLIGNIIKWYNRIYDRFCRKKTSPADS